MGCNRAPVEPIFFEISRHATGRINEDLTWDAVEPQLRPLSKAAGVQDVNVEIAARVSRSSNDRACRDEANHVV